MGEMKYLTVWWCLTHDAHWREGDVACFDPGYEESGNDCEYATKVLLDGAAAGERMVVVVTEDGQWPEDDLRRHAEGQYYSRVVGRSWSQMAKEQEIVESSLREDAAVALNALAEGGE
jgi:hypothetical protein